MRYERGVDDDPMASTSRSASAAALIVGGVLAAPCARIGEDGCGIVDVWPAPSEQPHAAVSA